MTTAAGWTTNQTLPFPFLTLPSLRGTVAVWKSRFKFPTTSPTALLLRASTSLAGRLKNFALEEFRAERITKVELRKMLGLERVELGGFLNSHGLPCDGYTLEEVNRQLQALRLLGI